MRANREAGTRKHAAKFCVAELNAKILAAKRQTKPAVARGIDLRHCAVFFFSVTGNAFISHNHSRGRVSDFKGACRHGNNRLFKTHLELTSLARSHFNSGILLIHLANLPSKTFRIGFNFKPAIIRFP